jgi:hypothetical protein
VKLRGVVLRSTFGRRMQATVGGLGTVGLVTMAVLALAVAGCTLPTPPPAPPAPPALATPIPVQVASWCDPSVNTCASAHVFWDRSVDSINQTVIVRAIGRATYLPVGWTGGYLGVQTDGNSVSGVVGPTAVFSLGGTGVSIGLVNGVPNPNCAGDFDGGAGASCRIPLAAPIAVGDVYRYRVTRLKTGWIRGQVVTPAGKTITIALLHPGPGAGTTFDGLYNFIEYFGAPVASITLVPRSKIRFGQPNPAAHISFVDRLLGACATASNDGTWGLRLQLGGGGCTA